MASTQTDSITQQAEQAVRLAEQQARAFYRIRLPDAAIDFSLRGRCAGQARVEPDGSTCLRFNRQLLADNLDDFLRQTIPHEVAHLVVNLQARRSRRRPQPHGPEWQQVMRECFDLEPRRCHDYQTTPARVVSRPYLYRCNCRQHHLTDIMHKRISRRYRVICKSCRTVLEYIASEKR